jgi:phosphopantothenoylcysteine decarboxylase/phosphopantothenate--cysteine ligase
VHEVPHIKKARESNLIVVAPATADLIAKISSGIADDLLTNVISAATCPIVLVPAMHPEMWLSAANQENIATLRKRGLLVIEPDEGRMTGDDFGVGRFPEVSRIIKEVSQFAEIKSDLLGRKVLVTAGGTREAIDPVRFIANHSTGKQGYAVAQAARNRGAEVVLIAANSNLIPLPGIKTINVCSTEQMQTALNEEFPNCEILIMAAAVADAKPANISVEKIKKANYQSIELEANPDLLATLSKTRRDNQVLVAFAAETASLNSETLEAAKAKMKHKGSDLIYLNNVSNGAIFGADETSGVLIDKNGETIECSNQSKDTLADLLLDRAVNKLG